MKKILYGIITMLLLLFQFAIVSETNAQIRHNNAGQKNGPHIKELKPLSLQEINHARNDIAAFLARFINGQNDLGCPDGFAFSTDAFSNMRKDLGMEKSCLLSGVCYSVSIYPAYNGTILYFVFKGEEYTPENFDHPTTMTTKSYYTLKAGNTEDLKEISPGSILRDKTESDILNYQTTFGNTSAINLKSLRIHLFKYDAMILAFWPPDTPQPSPTEPKKYHFIRLRLAYNEFSTQTNKLYSALNPEIATISSGGDIFRQITDNSSSWYNHMDPCPDKCPVDTKSKKVVLPKTKTAKKRY